MKEEGVYIDNSYNYHEELGYSTRKGMICKIITSVIKATEKNAANIAKNNDADKQQQKEIDSNKKVNDRQTQQINEISAKTDNNTESVADLAEGLSALTMVVSSITIPSLDGISGEVLSLKEDVSAITDDINNMNIDIDNIMDEVNSIHIEKSDSGYTLFVGTDERGTIFIPKGDDWIAALSAETEARYNEDEILRESINDLESNTEDAFINLSDRITSGETDLWAALHGLAENVEEITAEMADEFNEEINSIKETISGNNVDFQEQIDYLSGQTDDLTDKLFDLESECNEALLNESNARINGDEEVLSAATEMYDELKELIKTIDVSGATEAIVELDEKLNETILTFNEDIQTITEDLTVLNNKIETEKSERVEKDNELSETISGISIDLAVLKAIHDEDVDDINGRISGLTIGLDEEAEIRYNNDKNLYELIENISGSSTDFRTELEEIESSLNQEIENRTNAIYSISGQVDDLYENLSEEIAERNSADEILSSDIDYLSGYTSNLSNLIGNLENNVNTISGDLDTVKDSFVEKNDYNSFTSETDNRISAIESDYLKSSDINGFATEEELSSISGTLKTSIDSNASEIAALQENESAIQEDITELRSSVESYESTIETLTTNYDGMVEDIHALQKDVNEMKTRVQRIFNLLFPDEAY